LRALALLFKSLDDGRLQLGFIVDGKLSQEHEVAFASSQSYSRFIEKFFVGRDLEAEREVRAELIGTSIDEKASLSLSLSISGAQAGVAKAQEEVAAARADEVAELQQRLDTAEKHLSAVLEESKKHQVRNLYMLDHPPLLSDALLNAKRRLLIISPWIYGAVVDKEFLDRLEALLKRKVLVRIGYGINEEETKLKKTRDIEARNGLQKLAARYANFMLKRLGNTHAKILIKDEEYAVVTSFNWLSFRGDQDKKLRDEQGVLIGDPIMVNEKFAELDTRFTGGVKPPLEADAR